VSKPAIVPDVLSSAARPTTMETMVPMASSPAQGHLFDLGFYQVGAAAVSTFAEGTSPGPSWSPPPDTLVTIRPPQRHTVLVFALATAISAIGIAAAVAFL